MFIKTKVFLSHKPVIRHETVDRKGRRSFRRYNNEAATMNSNTIELNQTMLDIFDKSNRDYIGGNLPLNICYAVLGILGAVLSFLIVFVIAVTKELHNTSHYIIASQALVSACDLLGYFTNGIAKCSIYLSPATAVHTRKFCLWTQLLPIGFFQSAYFVSVFFLGLDRFLACYLPIFYQSKLTSPLYVAGYNFICFGYGIVFTGLLCFFTVQNPDELLSFCGLTNSHSATYLTVDDWLKNVFIFTTLSIYVALFLKVAKHYWWKKTSVNQAQRKQWAKQVHLKAMIGIMIIGFTYLLLRLISFINLRFAYGGYYRNPDIMIKSFGVSDLIDYSSHFFIYLAVDSTFRAAFVRLVRGDMVTPIVSSNNTKPAHQGGSNM